MVKFDGAACECKRSYSRGNIPCCLTEIWSLARSLEKGPLLQLESLRKRRVSDLLFFIIRLDKVSDDSAGLPLDAFEARVSKCY